MSVRFPSLGDQLKLTGKWTFPLHSEPRNTSLFAALGRLWAPWKQWAPGFILDVFINEDNVRYRHGWALVTLPVDTVLQVDRIYLRHGAK